MLARPDDLVGAEVAGEPSLGGMLGHSHEDAGQAKCSQGRDDAEPDSSGT